MDRQVRMVNISIIAIFVITVLLSCLSLTEARRHKKSWKDRHHSWDRNSINNNIDNSLGPLIPRKHQKITCDHMLSHLQRRHVVASFPPDVQGEWVSKRCEVRPGPEFLLRKYNFINETYVEALQFYYADASCCQALFTIIAKASLNVMRDSWLVPGGTEVDYQLNHVTIMTYTDAMAEVLWDHINSTCPGFVRTPWKAKEQHELMSFFSTHTETSWTIPYVDRDCTKALQFSIHELQLMRVEHTMTHHGVKRSLWLGDIHTDRLQRPYYRPTSYQEPLLPAKTASCPVCRLIHEADIQEPASLSVPIVPVFSLAGEWISEHCETRPLSLFLNRHLMFQQDSNIWDGYYDYFADPLCKKPMFSIFARGTYVVGPLSPHIEHAHHVNFKVRTLEVTARSNQMVSMLNYHHGNQCGKTGRWHLDVSQDVTITKGCQALGLTVPHVEFDLAKIELKHHKMWLYFGQRPSDGSGPTTPNQRPTSFQPPLLQCIHPPPRDHPNALPLVQEQEKSYAFPRRFHPVLLVVLVVFTWTKLTRYFNIYLV